MQVFAISPFSFVPEKGERKFRRILLENPEGSELGGARVSALRSVWIRAATPVPACIEVGHSHHPPVLFPWPRKIARARPCTVNPPGFPRPGLPFGVRVAFTALYRCFALQSCGERHDRFPLLLTISAFTRSCCAFLFFFPFLLRGQFGDTGQLFSCVRHFSARRTSCA